MDSPIITLTTDWSTRDFYVGKVKGRLFSSIPNVRVVDVSHDLPVADKFSAAYVVRNACMDFPKGTIHIIDACATRMTKNVVVIESGEQYYLMIDNGLPSLIFGEDYTQAVSLSNFRLPETGVFLAYDLFCPVAALIASDTPLSELGQPCEQLQPCNPYGYLCDGKQMTIYITHIDAYGNVYLGISYDEFEHHRKGRAFSMKVREHQLHEVVTPGGALGEISSSKVDLQLTVSSTGTLMLNCTEISENASRLFGLRTRNTINVTFQEMA